MQPINIEEERVAGETNKVSPQSNVHAVEVVEKVPNVGSTKKGIESITNS